MLRHNWIYKRVPHEQNYYNELEELYEKLNDQTGNRFTKEEAVDLLDLLLEKEFDAAWDIDNYFLNDDHNTVNGLIFFSLVLQIITIILLLIFIFVCKNQRKKFN